MGELSAGTVVLCRFPFSDLSSSKLRPCLIIAEAEFGDIIVCQITSKTYTSKTAISLKKSDFEHGSLVTNSFIRPDKLATLDRRIVTSSLGVLHQAKFEQCQGVLIRALGLRKKI